MSRINTNIPAIQTAHRLAFNQSDLAVRLERLSTGLRINRGRDDPAGLIASETLRSEIRGISQAIDNSQRAINVLSTAEGSLNEVSALLLDLRALVVNTANDGALSSSEIEANQLQVSSLLESIDRIANTTQFGGRKLIDGSFAYTTSGLATSAVAVATTFGARIPEGSTLGVVVEVTTSAELARLVYSGSAISENVTIEVKGNKGTEIVSFASGTTVSAIANRISNFSELTGVSAVVSGTGASSRLIFNSDQYGSSALVSVKPIDGTFIVAQGATTNDTGVDAGVLINGQTATVDGLTATLRSSGLDVELELTANRGTRLGTSTYTLTGGGALFQLGPSVNANAQISIGIPSIGTANLGDNVVGFLNTLNNTGALALKNKLFTAAEDVVTKAIDQVAVIRGRLGGLQKNQIETNINSQRVAIENVQAAESAIRDADIATEVAALTRAQILVQSATSILGLANQLPQTVLSLLG